MADLSYPLRLANQLILAGYPEPRQEFLFHHTRKWRLDLCWPQFLIGVEIDGGVWKTINKKTGELTSGRHNQPKGFISDLEKLNEAAFHYYRVFRFTTQQVNSLEAFNYLKKVFQCL